MNTKMQKPPAMQPQKWQNLQWKSQIRHLILPILTAASSFITSCLALLRHSSTTYPHRAILFSTTFSKDTPTWVTTRAILFSNHVFLLEQATEYCLRWHPSLADKISDSPEIWKTPQGLCTMLVHVHIGADPFRLLTTVLIASCYGTLQLTTLLITSCYETLHLTTVLITSCYETLQLTTVLIASCYETLHTPLCSQHHVMKPYSSPLCS